MTTYQTSQVSKIIGIHPNTVRLYEKIGFISAPDRLKNGYRVFTELHIEQCKLIRLGLQVEVVQNGLRKKIIQMIRKAAEEDYDGALLLAAEYIGLIRLERARAEEAIEAVKNIISCRTDHSQLKLKRKDVSNLLDISMDTLRNWEMNGLLTVKRKENGYRVYTETDIQRLKIIRVLRCANYSLEAILRLLRELSQNPKADIETTLNTPEPSEDIISVCDQLIISLSTAEQNAQKAITLLNKMKRKFS
ncbi:DNA-binding transcriptional MerR regulator [Clostridiales Family XIII bacterium PM5-7]